MISPVKLGHRPLQQWSEKTNGSKRICITFTHIHKSIQRVIHPIASFDDSLVKLVNCRTFSNLDTRRKFWQIHFAKESRYNIVHFSQTILDQQGDLLETFMFDDRIVIPHELRIEIFNRTYEGHLGTAKRNARASSSIWWRHITTDRENLVKDCTVSNKDLLFLYASVPGLAWMCLNTCSGGRLLFLLGRNTPP